MGRRRMNELVRCFMLVCSFNIKSQRTYGLISGFIISFELIALTAHRIVATAHAGTMSTAAYCQTMGVLSMGTG